MIARALTTGVAALVLAAGTAHAKKPTGIEPTLPPYFSGVWCYRKIASEEAIKPVSIYERGEDIEDCANRGGFHYMAERKRLHIRSF
jgi:hypothetical protein